MKARMAALAALTFTVSPVHDDSLYAAGVQQVRHAETGLVEGAAAYLEEAQRPILDLDPVDPGRRVVAEWKEADLGDGNSIRCLKGSA